MPWPITPAPSWPISSAYQINPLIKDYNGPACAYVTGPFGGYTANAQGRALHRVRLLERADDARVLAASSKAATARCSSSSTHLAHETIERDREHPAHQRTADAAGASTPSAAPTTASAWSRCTSPRSASARGHSASGVWVDERGRDHGARSLRRRATWRACRTTTCSAPSSTATSPARKPPGYCAEVDLPDGRRRRGRGGAGARAGADRAAPTA